MLVVVDGDVTLDRNLARVQTSVDQQGWTEEARLAMSSQPGGGALLGRVVRAVAAAVDDHLVVHAPELESDGRISGTTTASSYALWTRVDDRGRGAWRVHEYLGLELPTSSAPAAARQGTPVEADVVVLDDAALGFRDAPERWPAAILETGRTPWVIVKSASPIADGPLWDHLLQHHADRLVVVMTIGDLRRTEVQISRELSWERTAQDLVWELVYNPRVNGLARCAHTVVSLGAAGAAVLSCSRGGDAKPDARLVFDPAVIEGEWERARHGGMIGGTTALTAGIVRSVLRDPNRDIVGGVQAGLAALRALHMSGYDAAEAASLEFPVNRVVASLDDGGDPFAVVEVADPAADRAATGSSGAGEYWTILRDRYPADLDGLATRVVIEGPEVALEAVPLGRFGALLTVDRHEIEAYRSIRGLVAEYAGRAGESHPLSIAVFGAPGSGKSFGVKQVAKALLPPDQLATLTFNVAQFDTPHDLVDALHQVRDVGLRGQLPLVFWDEFDSTFQGQSLGWLRHFLAPMQDGEFQEGQLVHPIGRAVFVFAGGTATSMTEFRSARDPDAFRNAKAPDFVSRLRGFVNVLGPNPRVDADGNAASDDPYFVIRRAILLRSVLERMAPQLRHRLDGTTYLDIDPGVLRALLHVGRFKHGARSMESIVATSRLAGLSTFERSSLPTEDQLDLHVDGSEFLALVEELQLQGELLERLAEAAHDVYCESVRALGYAPGDVNDEAARTLTALRPWAELSEGDRDASRANVRDIPAKLARIGCLMVPARGDEAAFAFTDDELDRLAYDEHERWVEHKRAAGWTPGTPTDKNAKVHEGLVEWDELGADQRAKDRDLVAGIPVILARGGYTVLWSRR